MTRRTEIEVIDPVACRINRNESRYIVDAISYEKSYWEDTPQGKRQHFYNYSMWLKKTNTYFYFLTGHLKKVLKHCREKKVEVNIIRNSSEYKIEEVWDASLKGIEFFPNQIEAIDTAILNKRGVIKAPTRTGKTVIQYGIFDTFYVNTLIIAHNVDLVKQLAEEGRKFGFEVFEVHGKKKELYWEKEVQVVVMTRSSAANMLKKKSNSWMKDFFKMVFIDETHHITTPEGQYAKILTAIKAPLRFGFTATLPDTMERKMCLEGFIGPLIYDLSINEAVEKGLLVDPKIRLIKTDMHRLPTSMSYPDVYMAGIVENFERHDQIAEVSVEYIAEGKSVLILVNKIDHGLYQQYAFKKIGIKVPFICGDTSTEERTKAKEDLISKKLMCVIVSTVWKEGINIPTLDVCINAAGGVSEISTLQGVGRSLTKAEGKKEAIIVDVFDKCHHYLIRHFGERISLYMEQGWL